MTAVILVLRRRLLRGMWPRISVTLADNTSLVAGPRGVNSDVQNEPI